MREVRPPLGWRLIEFIRDTTCCKGFYQWVEAFASTDGSKTSEPRVEHRWDEFFTIIRGIRGPLIGPRETGSLRWAILWHSFFVMVNAADMI